MEDVRSSDGAVIRYRQHGNLNGPRLVLSHGNGFAIEGYYAFWRLFLDRYEVLLHDLRNHGHNPYCGPDNHNYRGFVGDYRAMHEAVPRLFGEKPTAALYHSSSALAALHDIHANGWHWDAMVLYDPQIIPEDGHPLRPPAVEFDAVMSEWALARPDRFKSPDDLAAGFKATRSLSDWADGSHELIARSVLRRDQRNGYVLACPKELEADIYLANTRGRIWHELRSAAPHADKILFLSSDPELKGSKAPSRILPTLPETFGFQVKIMPGTRHLMQLEKPEMTARETIAFLEGQGLIGAD